MTRSSGGLFCVVVTAALALCFVTATAQDSDARRRPAPRKRVRISKVSVGKGLPKPIVRRIVRRDLRRIRACFPRGRRALATRRILVSFTVGPQGKVIVAGVTGRRATARCVRRAIRRITFPRPVGGAIVPVFVEFRVGRGVNPLGGIVGGPIGNPAVGNPGLPRPGLGGVRRPLAPRISYYWPSLRVVGSLDKEIIKRFLKRSGPRVRNCYQRELVVNPNLRGTMRVRFIILPTGNTRAARVAGLHPKVDACVKRVFDKLRFLKTRGGGIVVVKVQLRATGVVLPSGFVAFRGFSGRVVRVKNMYGASRQPIHDGIRRNERRLGGCYLRRLRKNPQLRGDVMAKFHVGASGVATRVSAWGMGAVSGCVAHVLRTTRFRPVQTNRRGGTAIDATYKFRFRAKK